METQWLFACFPLATAYHAILSFTACHVRDRLAHTQAQGPELLLVCKGDLHRFTVYPSERKNKGD